MSMVELLDKGMRCLREGLGDIESEEFIAIVLRERFDYTKWQEKMYDGMSLEEISAAAKELEEKYPVKLAP